MIMRHLLLTAHRRQEGSPLIFGLAAMAFLIIPLCAVLLMTANASNSSQAAQGIAYSVSYATMSRAIDLGQTSSPDSPGGIVLKQNDPQVYAEAEQAVRVASNVSAGGILRDRLTLVPRPDSAPYRDTFAPLNYNPSVGIVNVPAAPEGNRSFVGDVKQQRDGNNDPSCTNGVILNELVGNHYAACWTDLRAKSYPSGDSSTVYPVSAHGGRSSAWDHYASGAEAVVQFSSDNWLFGNLTANRVGVATFGRPCVEGEANCTQ